MSSKASIWPNLPKLVAKTSSLDQAPVPVLWVDESGYIGYANSQLCSVVGYANETLMNQKLDFLIPSLSASNWTKQWWPLLIKDRTISSLSATLHHQKGMAMERDISAAIVDVAGLKFAAFYLWPKVNAAATINTSSATDFLENLNECVAILDKSGKVYYANPALCNKLSVQPADLTGHSLFDFMTPTQSQLNNVWQALQQTQTSEIEFECQNMTGEELVLRMNAVPQQSEVKGQEQLLVSFVDITEQHRIARKLKERNTSFERLASNIPGFIYKFKMTAEGDFSFPYASIGCQEIFGVDPVDVVNDATPIVNTIHEQDIQGFQDSVLESATHLTPWNLEARLSTIKDEWKWFHAASRPELQENGDIIWEGLVMDVTDRKQAEAELAKAKEAAEASAAAKAAFLSNMSHEIRTPLNAVIGLTRLVLATDLLPIQQEYINKVLSSSEVLLGIINNVLDFSKIESGKLAVEQIEFSLTSVLENIANILEAKAAEKGLELLIDNYPDDFEHLVGDPLRLEQVLINLCNNAIKFTETGEILISVQQEQQQNGFAKLKFIVKDTGIGLTETQQQKIFESFTQADNTTTRKYGGTGLGLTICKQIVELMGGEIGVESEIDKGSRFFFTAVLGRSTRSSDKNILIASEPETTKKHILYIDDNPTACQLNTQTLESFGLDVKSVDSGNTAIEAIDHAIKKSLNSLYDLIIVDWDMPEMDGIETVQQIKSLQGYAETPIILMISSFAIDRIKTLIDEDLVDAIIIKPLIKSKLANTIQNLLNKKNQQPVVQTEEVSSAIDHSESLLAGRTVLLAEDNAINQEIAQKLLESKGIKVLVVNNGREAVDLLLANHNKITFDAVLMDLQMPEMDGFEATRIIRENSNFDSIPIIAMTAHAFASEKQKCLAAGMQDHVSKPIQPTRLFNTLSQYFQSTQKQSEELASFKQSCRENTETSATDIELSTVDVNSAKKMLNEDGSLLNKLLLKFAHDQSDTIRKLKRQVNYREHSCAAETTHLIKGIAGNLHITDVFDSAVDLEDALRNQSQEKVEVLLERFENNFCQFADELKQASESRGIVIANQKPPNNKDIIAQDKVLEKLEQLIGYLDNNNFKAESCLEELTPFLAKFYEQEERQFTDLMMDLNFSAAAEIARDLKKQLSESCFE